MRMSQDGRVARLLSVQRGRSLLLAGKISCGLCLQLVSKKSAETSLRVGFK